MHDSSRPHGLQPTRLLHPWDSPGKSTEWVAIAFPDIMLHYTLYSVYNILYIKRSYHMPEVRGGSREVQPHVKGVAAMWAQEGQEELLHAQGQEWWP